MYTLIILYNVTCVNICNVHIINTINAFYIIYNYMNMCCVIVHITCMYIIPM